jgi:hypothetical protein
MSHIVTVKTKVHDPVAVAAACQRLNLTAPVLGTATLFSGEASGLLVQLPGWQYPTVIDTHALNHCEVFPVLRATGPAAKHPAEPNPSAPKKWIWNPGCVLVL